MQPRPISPTGVPAISRCFMKADTGLDARLSALRFVPKIFPAFCFRPGEDLALDQPATLVDFRDLLEIFCIQRLLDGGVKAIFVLAPLDRERNRNLTSLHRPRNAYRSRR